MNNQKFITKVLSKLRGTPTPKKYIIREERKFGVAIGNYRTDKDAKIIEKFDTVDAALSRMELLRMETNTQDYYVVELARG